MGWGKRYGIRLYSKFYLSHFPVEWGSELRIYHCVGFPVAISHKLKGQNSF